MRQLGLVLARLRLGALALGDVLAEHGGAGDDAVFDDRMDGDEKVLLSLAVRDRALDLDVFARRTRARRAWYMSSQTCRGTVARREPALVLDAEAACESVRGRREFIAWISPSRSTDQIAVGGVLDQGRERRLGAPQLRLHALALGDVGRDAAHADRRAGRVEERELHRR